MPYRVINIYYSVTCYTNHINSTRIQSIASMALMVFPDAETPSPTYIITHGFETHTEKNVARSATEFKFANSVCGAGWGRV